VGVLGSFPHCLFTYNSLKTFNVKDVAKVEMDLVHAVCPQNLCEKSVRVVARMGCLVQGCLSVT
jgi:hypothetical protein